MNSLRRRSLIKSASQEIKSKKLKRMLATYIQPSMYQHIDDVKRTFVFGKNQYIGALTTNTLHSGIFAQSVIKEAEPEYLILGNFNNYHLSQYTLKKPSLIYKIQDLFCKDQFSQYISESENNPEYKGIFSSDDRLFYEIDERYQQVWTDDYMTAGLNSLTDDEVKVLYGSPSTIVTLQDLMLRFQLRQLQDIYSQVIGHVRTSLRDQIHYSPRLIETCIREVALEKFKNTLHTKSMLYTASLFRNCAKLGKSNLLFCNRHVANEIRHFIQRSDSNTETIYRGYLTDPSHYDAETYSRVLKETSKDQLLRKFYLVSQLVDNTALQSLQMGFNVLRESIFAKKLPRSSASDLFSEITKKSQKYTKQILEVQTQFITNNLTIGQREPTRRLLLDEQLELIEERKEDFPTEYQSYCLESDQKEEVELNKLQSIMEQYLKMQHRVRDLQLLKQYREKKYSQENIILYTKLLGELKIKTGSQFKLPLHHFKQFRGYFKEVMRDQILEQQYGIQKSKQIQQAINYEIRDDLSLEEIQEIVKNKNFVKNDSTNERLVDTKYVMENWEKEDETFEKK